MKTRRTVVVAFLMVFGAAAASAQDFKFEFTPYVGYTASEGFKVQGVEVESGKIVDKINPKSSASWGLNFDYLVGEHFSIGFLWNQQFSELTGNVQGGGTYTATKMKVHNYHGVFTYNFGEEDSTIRPFILGGLGATHYSPGEVNGSKLNTLTKFSTTWGGGVKFFAGPHVGLKLMARGTPTYIKSDPAGVWCSPWWPWSCWVVGSPDYSNQGEFSAGVTFRF